MREAESGEKAGSDSMSAAASLAESINTTGFPLGRSTAKIHASLSVL